MSTRTLHLTVLASDIPLWCIKAFEAIDYDRLTWASRQMLMSGLKAWCASQPQRTSNYQASERKTPIPQELAYVINLVDFDRMSPHSVETAKHFLEKTLFTMAPKWGS